MFSRNAPDGGFARVASQLTIFTKCLNEVFLSYCRRLLSQHQDKNKHGDDAPDDEYDNDNDHHHGADHDDAHDDDVSPFSLLLHARA